MLLKLLRTKIHRATITDANVDYVGSITIDEALLEAIGLLVGEEVLVADLANGVRFHTYVIPGRRGGGEMVINGAAAKLVSVGDRIIVMSFAYVTPEEARSLKPGVILVDERNRVLQRL